MEKIKRENCCLCGSTELENIFQVKTGEPVKVFVRCSKCGAFVARYTLKCYTTNKTYESYIENLKGESESGHKTLNEIEFLSQDIQKEFKRLTGLIKTSEEKKKIEDIIIEDQ
ncbi:hypothetical protein J7L48_08250 [bacterium]|nr:hypothetical protein [bacterium]